MFYWLIKRIVLGPVLFALFRPWVRGQELVPTTGGVILASNHLSFSDSIFLPLVLRRRVTFLAKADYFTGRGLKGRATAIFFRLAGQVPVDRSGGEASDRALQAGLQVLHDGEALGIYPEGTRSPDGRLYRGKTGVARMALEARVPVVPVVMVGTAEVQPIGQVVPNIRRVGIVFGEPLDFSRYEGMESDRHVLRSITDEIMYALMELSGQEYVDEYASSMKERIAAAGRAAVPAAAKAAASAATALSQAGGSAATALSQAGGSAATALTQAGERVRSAATDRHRRTSAAETALGQVPSTAGTTSGGAADDVTHRPGADSADPGPVPAEPASDGPGAAPDEQDADRSGERTA